MHDSEMCADPGADVVPNGTLRGAPPKCEFFFSFYIHDIACLCYTINAYFRCICLFVLPRPRRESVKLISTKLINLVSLEQIHHKPIGMYGESFYCATVLKKTFDTSSTSSPPGQYFSLEWDLSDMMPGTNQCM